MAEIKYSEKEISIFNGLINLMKEGINPYAIKVSDIAKAADIGKGTIYDYFDSKEEVISKAIVYSIGEEIRLITEKVRDKDKFKDRYYAILEIIGESHKKKLSTLGMLLSSGGIDKFYESLKDKECAISDFIDLINGEIVQLLNLGIQEKKIESKEIMEYKIMAVIGSMHSFSYYYNNKSLHKKLTTEDAKDMAYKILLKSLS
ncbi:MAG: TetR/AcrR family transcriptional regulator [Tissierellaceae bacterium]